MRPSPKSEAIYRDLKNRIQSGQFQPGQKLPTMAELTRQLQTCLGTVSKSLKLLEEDGLIRRRGGSGVFVRNKDGGPEPVPVLVPHKSKPEEIAEQIIASIARGDLRVGQFLPLQKALQYEYKAAKRTMSEALKFVAQKGLIHRKGAGYIVGPPDMPQPGRRTQQKIVVIGVIDTFQRRIRANRNKTFLQAMESEAAKQGFGLETIDLESSTLHRPEFLARPDILGIVYAERAFRFDEQELKRDLQSLARAKRPIVWTHFNGVLHYSSKFAKSLGRNIHPMAIAYEGRSPGEMAGEYLALRGHRSVAFFSLFDHAYCRHRFEGVRQGLTKILGTDCGIEYHTAAFENAPEKETYTPRRERAVLVDRFYVELFKRAVTHLNPRMRVISRMNESLYTDISYEKLEPFFEAALKNRDITAWVFAEGNPQEAGSLFLAARKVKVPDRLSLVCIEDWEPALLDSVTSFDFNLATAGYLAAHAILGDIPIKRNRKGIVECTGRMIERGSVKRV